MMSWNKLKDLKIKKLKDFFPTVRTIRWFGVKEFG